MSYWVKEYRIKGLFNMRVDFQKKNGKWHVFFNNDGRDTYFPSLFSDGLTYNEIRKTLRDKYGISVPYSKDLCLIHRANGIESYRYECFQTL